MGYIELFLVALLFGIILIFLNKKKYFGLAVLSFLFLALLLSSNTWVSEKLALFLSVKSSEISSINQIERPLAIILLDSSTTRYKYGDYQIERSSDNGLCRAMMAAHIFQSLKNPIVIISGGVYQTDSSFWTPEGTALLELLVNLKIPKSKIILDSNSRSTYEHAINVLPILKSLDINNFVLVTSSTHMLRAIKTFEKQGLAPIGKFSAEKCLIKDSDIRPSLNALIFTQEIFHEYFGLIYYKIKGFL